MTIITSEWLESTTIDELLEAQATLKSELADIDTQLSGVNRMDGTNYRLPLAEYNEWRKKAVFSKSHKTRELIAIKAQISKRQSNGSTHRGISESRFWYQVGHRFLPVLEALYDRQDIPVDVTNMVVEAINFYDDLSEKRVQEKK